VRSAGAALDSESMTHAKEWSIGMFVALVIYTAIYTSLLTIFQDSTKPALVNDTLSPHQIDQSRFAMASFFKSRSAASSRRSSIAETRPTNSEIFTEPAPGCGPKKTHTYTADQQVMVSWFLQCDAGTADGHSSRENRSTNSKRYAHFDTFPTCSDQLYFCSTL
jgi:hypothetical protein